MDRPVTSLRLLRQLARHLIEHSLRFEPFVPGADPGPIGALSLLGTLERVTRENLNLESGPADPEARQTVPPTPVVPSAELLPRFGTNRSEYGPALQDPSVIQALLALQNREETDSPKQAKPPAPVSYRRSSPSTSPILRGTSR